MKILFLGYPDSPLIEFIRQGGDQVIIENNKIDTLQVKGVDLVVSYGYRHILRKDFIDLFPRKIVNLHISYLPWNRGADPNFWSFVEETPKGVTIHYMDEGIDTGEIIVQKKIEFDESETLKTTYEILQREIIQLFKDNWKEIRTGGCQSFAQQGPGSCHKLKDKESLAYLTEEMGFDTPVSALKLRK